MTQVYFYFVNPANWDSRCVLFFDYAFPPASIASKTANKRHDEKAKKGEEKRGLRKNETQ